MAPARTAEIRTAPRFVRAGAKLLRVACPARDLAEGVTISVRMTRKQHDFFVASMEAQNGPAENFVLRALITGAAFLGRGGRVKSR